MTWRLTQENTAVSGTLQGNGNTGRVDGTVSGTLNGTTLTFTLTVPQGGFAGFPSCSFVGSGTANASQTSLIGTFSGTNSCFGPVSDGQFNLTRQ
jgi:hypothetical protein